MALLQKHCDAATSDLRSCLDALKQEKEQANAARSEAADLRDQIEELKRQLVTSVRKVDLAGESERRQAAELLQLRREHDAVQDALQRCRVDLAEAREKLARSEGEAGRSQQLAAKATAEGGTAVAQLHALRTRVTDLETRNAHLLAELVAAREEGRAAAALAPADRATASRMSFPPPPQAHLGDYDGRRDELMAAAQGGPAAAGAGGSRIRSESLKSLLYNGAVAAGGGGDANPVVSLRSVPYQGMPSPPPKQLFMGGAPFTHDVHHHYNDQQMLPDASASAAVRDGAYNAPKIGKQTAYAPYNYGNFYDDGEQPPALPSQPQTGYAVGMDSSSYGVPQKRNSFQPRSETLSASCMCTVASSLSFFPECALQT